VLLAYSPKNEIDAFKDENELLQFGAIILDGYDCDDCDLAYRRLHEAY